MSTRKSNRKDKCKYFKSVSINHMWKYLAEKESTVKLRKNIWNVLYANSLMSGHLIAWNGLKDLKEQTEDQKNMSQVKVLYDPKTVLDDLLGKCHF